MANYTNLKAAIDNVIKTNGNKEITGSVLNQTLNAMVNSLGVGYQFAGMATPSTNPGTPDQNVFYFATQAGMYSNFNNIVLPDGISILSWNGSWSSSTFSYSEGVFDISAYHATGGTLAEYADLTAALGTSGANIPEPIRKGGMSVKFVLSSDNKYVQYRLMSDSFNTTADNWQGVDDEPVADSKNLVESGGTYKELNPFVVIKNHGILANGAMSEADGYGCTGFIPLNGATTLKWLCGVQNTHYVLVLYNGNKERLDNFGSFSGERVIDISSYSTAVYVRASFLLSASNYYLKDGNDKLLGLISLKSITGEPDINSPEPISSYAVKSLKDKMSFNDVSSLIYVKNTSAYEVGTLPTTLPSTNGRIRSVNYIEIETFNNLQNVLVVEPLGSTYKLNIYFYNSSYNSVYNTDFLPEGVVSNVEIPRTAKYIKYLIRRTDNNDFSSVPEEVYYYFKVWQKANGNKYITDVLDKTVNSNKNYVENVFINNQGNVYTMAGVNISERILVKNTTFTWNYGTGVAYDTNAKLCIFDKKSNLLDFYTITDTTTNSRTIDISGKSFASDAVYIVFSFAGFGASLVQGGDVWQPNKGSVPTNNEIKYLDVATYNVGEYRRNAQYMTEEDKAGFLKQFKDFMNGNINKDIIFIQEELTTFTDGGETVNVYKKYYKQFYPYSYICRPGWGAIYSKYPLKNCREFDFAYTPTGGTELHRYHALAEIEINGKTIGIGSVHCNFYVECQQQEYEALINQMKDYDYVILGGDYNVDVSASDEGSCPVIENTFGKAGYKSANWGYWGNIHTQTDVNNQGTPTKENQIDSFVVKGFDINSFKVYTVAYYDHMPCVSKLNFSIF